MRVFVSGASGVIGRRVVPLLLSHGHAVTVATRPASARAGPKQAGVNQIAADLFDKGSLDRAVRGHDAIINLATHMPSSAWKMLFRSSWRLNDRIRREGVANLVAAALSQGVVRFIRGVLRGYVSRLR